MKKQSIKERIKALNAKQKRRFKTALIMSLLSIVLLSGATFAWFTISNSASVNKLEMTVVAEGALKISDTENTVFTANKTSIDFTMADTKLYPCTTIDGKTMKKPVYSGSDVVSGVADILAAEKNMYYFEKDIYLGVVEAGGGTTNDYAITLSKKTSEGKGSFVKYKEGTTTTHPEYSIRISFEASDGTIAVYEPNSEGNIGTSATEKEDYAVNDAGTGYTGANLHQQLENGTFTAIQDKTPYYEGDSSELFTIKANTQTKVTVRIWYEGTDRDCINAIQDGTVEGMFTFVSHKKTV